jgi:hypothetical protein
MGDAPTCAVFGDDSFSRYGSHRRAYFSGRFAMRLNFIRRGAARRPLLFLVEFIRIIFTFR